jgi:hypothetical protein
LSVLVFSVRRSSPLSGSGQAGDDGEVMRIQMMAVPVVFQFLTSARSGLFDGDVDAVVARRR